MMTRRDQHQHGAHDPWEDWPQVPWCAVPLLPDPYELPQPATRMPDLGALFMNIWVGWIIGGAWCGAMVTFPFLYLAPFAFVYGAVVGMGVGVPFAFVTALWAHRLLRVGCDLEQVDRYLKGLGAWIPLILGHVALAFMLPGVHWETVQPPAIAAGFAVYLVDACGLAYIGWRMGRRVLRPFLAPEQRNRRR